MFPSIHAHKFLPTTSRYVVRRSLIQVQKTNKSLYRQFSSQPKESFEHSSNQQQLIWRLCLGGVAIGTTYFGYMVYRDFFSTSAIQQAEQQTISTPLIEGNPVVFMDLATEEEELGRIIIQLRKDVVPVTVENFRSLFTGEKGFGYRGSKFFHIVPGNYAVAGDFEHNDGSGGHSIYKDRQGRFAEFADENYVLKHTGPGIISSASVTRGRNASQFFITFGTGPMLDRRYVAFGNVIHGMDVLKRIETNGDWRGTPKKAITIRNCGELRPRKEDSSQ